MTEQTVHFEQIGVIHTSFKNLENMPIQPKGAIDSEGTVELFPEFAEGLKDLDGFSHAYLLYHFHMTKSTRLTVTPFLDDTPRGVFATRAPVRPNHIGLSVIEIIAVEQNKISVRGIDVLDGTPLLDIKPYMEKFDHPSNSSSGWMMADDAQIKRRRSDRRFH